MSTGVGNHNHGLINDANEIQSKNLNTSYSEDSVAETALSKKNSDGVLLFCIYKL